MIRQIAFAAGLAALAFTTQGASAQTATRSVSYTDLDLSSPEGQARLDARLRHAADAVCGIEGTRLPLAEEMQARRCAREAIGNARATYAAARTNRVLSR